MKTQNWIFSPVSTVSPKPNKPIKNRTIMKNNNEINRRKFIRITAGSAVAVAAASGLEQHQKRY
jgi:hypothetical protein